MSAALLPPPELSLANAARAGFIAASEVAGQIIRPVSMMGGETVETRRPQELGGTTIRPGLNGIERAGMRFIAPLLFPGCAVLGGWVLGEATNGRQPKGGQQNESQNPQWQRHKREHSGAPRPRTRPLTPAAGGARDGAPFTDHSRFMR